MVRRTQRSRNRGAVAREFARLYLAAAEIDPTASDPAVTRGIRRTIRSKFPGLRVAEMKRASDVAMDEMAAFVEEFDRRTKEMGALIDAWTPTHGTARASLPSRPRSLRCPPNSMA